MSILDRRKEVDYERFEHDLLQVLKKDKDHKIPFDRKFAFYSRRYNCLLAAADVRLDSKTGNLVMVGAFKSGKQIIDNSKGYPVMKTEIEIPLRECYEDIKHSSGQEDNLILRSKKAVLDKYVTGYLDTFERKGISEGRKLVFDDFNLEEFKLSRSTVMEIVRNGDEIILTSGNSFVPRFDTKMSRFTLCEVQELGKHLEDIQRMYDNAVKAFISRKQQLEPLNMTYSELDAKEHNDEALAAMYRKKFPLPICNSVAKNLAGSDIFDLSIHSKEEISKFVSGYSPRKATRKPTRTLSV